MFFPTAAAALAALLALAGAVQAHEGHDHGPPPASGLSVATPRTDASAESFELVAILRDGALALWLDHFADNAPILDAAITVETPAGPVVAQAVGDGSYRIPAPWADRPGRIDLIFTIAVAGASDVVLASLIVPQPPSPAAAAARFDLLSAPSALAGAGFLAGVLLTLAVGRRRLRAGAVATMIALAFPAFADPAQRLPDGDVFLPKPNQRILEIRTIRAVVARHGRTIELPGRIIPDPDASGVAAAAVAGRLSPPPGGFPKLGARVKADDVLGRVEPALQAIDASDQQQRAGELDQQIAIVRRRVERLRALRDVVAAAQTEEAAMELNGLLDRRRRLDVSRRSPDILIAPVGGVIAASAAVAGMIAIPNAAIFQIVDPSRLWVEALSYQALPTIASAAARLPDGRSLALEWRGSGLAAAKQATPIHFAILGDAVFLRPGQLVSVLVATGDAREGIALPRASLLRGSDGQSLVWEHVAPERFRPRLVRAESLNGELTLVLAGIESGARVVTQGGELLNQIR